MGKRILNSFASDFEIKRAENQKNREHQHYLFETVMSTYETYKTDKDVDKALPIIEQCLINDDDPFYTPHSMRFLVQLYLQKGLNDRAWGYLNSLLIKPDKMPSSVVYGEMAKLLKKETKN